MPFTINARRPPRRDRRAAPRWFVPALEAPEQRLAPATFAVTTAADNGDNASPIAGSLRQAILLANSTSGRDSIAFSIPGGGPHTIQPLSALPTITDPVIIDGYTQPRATPNTLADGDNAVLKIELNGISAGSGASGLRVHAPGSTVRGLVINRFQADGITIQAPGGAGVGDNVVVAGKFIGTDATGRVVRRTGFGGNGVLISNSPNNRIGGNSPADRNVISGNDSEGVEISGPASTGNKLLGNFIGPPAHDGVRPGADLKSST